VASNEDGNRLFALHNFSLCCKDAILKVKGMQTHDSEGDSLQTLRVFQVTTFFRSPLCLYCFVSFSSGFFILKLVFAFVKENLLPRAYRKAKKSKKKKRGKRKHTQSPTSKPPTQTTNTTQSAVSAAPQLSVVCLFVHSHRLCIPFLG
jgi:hypothetical protein